MSSLSSGHRQEAMRLLGLEGPVERFEVVTAYRRLARTHHPDLGGDPELFRSLTLARDLLLADADASASGRARSPAGRSVTVRQRPSRRLLRRLHRLHRRLGRSGGGRRHLE